MARDVAVKTGGFSKEAVSQVPGLPRLGEFIALLSYGGLEASSFLVAPCIAP